MRILKCIWNQGCVRVFNVRKMKRKFEYASKLACVVLLLCCVSSVVFVQYWLATASLLLFAIIFINWLTVKKMRKPVLYFDSRCSIRNVDNLIIGELCYVEDFIVPGETYIQLCAPFRKTHSSFEILRHTHSILKEPGGRVSFVLPKQNLSTKSYSIFDIPIFSMSPTSIKYLNMEYKKYLSLFPVCISPVKSLRLLLNIRHHVLRCECPKECIPIMEFCKDRELDISFYTITKANKRTSKLS